MHWGEVSPIEGYTPYSPADEDVCFPFLNSGLTHDQCSFPGILDFLGPKSHLFLGEVRCWLVSSAQKIPDFPMVNQYLFSLTQLLLFAVRQYQCGVKQVQFYPA